MFPNARNFGISNSHFTNVVNNHSTGPSGIDILLEASTPEAAHDSSARDPPPRCSPGTRKEFVEDILHWAVPPGGSSPLPVYWMKGPAGVGKSAVAQTSVEELQRQGHRCPAFFFSINGRNKHQKFFPSIAYQLAMINSDYHDLIDRKIRRHKTLVDKTMETQFWGLLVEPLQELEEQGKGIGERIPVFVDGLDECESQDAQCEIIEIVAAAARDGATSLCWAFFSRPEPHIDATFSKTDISPTCHMTILPISRDADGDIKLYLQAGFRNTLRRLNITVSSPWPSESDMKMLVRTAGGLFIYAKTVLRFVGRPGSLNPEALLHAIIAVISNHNRDGIVTEHAFVELDAFYMLIMQRIPANMLPIIRRVLVLLCLSSHSGAILIANSLGLSRVVLEAACQQMSAVVHFQHQQEPLELDPAIDTRRSFLRTTLPLTMEARRMIAFSLGGRIFFYHKSFQDFLLLPHRSGIYCVQTMQESVYKREQDIALQLENRYRWKGSELVRERGVPDSTSTLSYPYTNELVSSFVEALIYYSINTESDVCGADFDFRKQLYVAISVSKGAFTNPYMSRTTLYRCAGFFKYLRRTQIRWFQPGELPKFNDDWFQKEVERRQRGNIIQPYYPIPPSLTKPRGRVKLGLYVVGHGSKSIFWYWVIDYDSETYREFKTIDLAEGEVAYREQFDLEGGELKKP